MEETEELRKRLESFLGERLDERVHVPELRRLPGGASRESWQLVAEGAGTGARRLVLQRDSPAPAGSRATEFEILRRARRAGAPVPPVLWLDATGEELGSPGFVMELVEGETIARRILRDDEYEGARRVLASQCGAAVARIHGIDVSDLDGLDPPGGPPALTALRSTRRALDVYGEPHPALELGARWLERRAPEPARITLVHGDFRNGNLIVGPEGLRAVLDWEVTHLGDPWEDLGWICCRVWRFGGWGEVGGFGAREDLYRAYEEASGVPVDRNAVRWWEIFSSFKWGLGCLSQSFKHLWGHIRSHEHAAIGRRTAETEYDLLTLIREAEDGAP